MVWLRCRGLRSCRGGMDVCGLDGVHGSLFRGY